MAKIPSLQRLLIEDFPKESDWIPKLIGPLNDFMENSIYALTRQITFTDNVNAQIQSIQVQGSTGFLCDISQGSNIISNLNSTVGFYANMPVAGLGIPSSTKIVSFANKAAITGNTTSGSNVVVNIGSTSGLIVGQPLTGNGIPANTSILSVDGANQIHMSAAALSTASNTSIVCSSAASLSNNATETDHGVNLVAGGSYPVTFNCTLTAKPAFLWVVQAAENSSSPITLTESVFCDWSYNSGSIVINNITGLKGSLVSGSPRTFNLTLLLVTA